MAELGHPQLYFLAVAALPAIQASAPRPIKRGENYKGQSNRRCGKRRANRSEDIAGRPHRGELGRSPGRQQRDGRDSDEGQRDDVDQSDEGRGQEQRDVLPAASASAGASLVTT
jgi:hypothetical protein